MVLALRRALVRRQSAGAPASLSFMVVICSLSTRLIPNFHVSLPNPRGTAVSLETKPIFRFPFRMSAL